MGNLPHLSCVHLISFMIELEIEEEVIVLNSPKALHLTCHVSISFLLDFNYKILTSSNYLPAG